MLSTTGAESILALDVPNSPASDELIVTDSSASNSGSAAA
jgi:hypothetical protein